MCPIVTARYFGTCCQKRALWCGRDFLRANLSVVDISQFVAALADGIMLPKVHRRQGLSCITWFDLQHLCHCLSENQVSRGRAHLLDPAPGLQMIGDPGPEVSQHTYFKWIPELKEVVRKKDGNEDFANALLEKYFKPIEGHDWFFNGMGKEAIEKVRNGYEDRYGQGYSLTTTSIFASTMSIFQLDSGTSWI